MDVKIDEIYKRLTISIRLNMGGDLGDLLDLTDNALFSDIEHYVDFTEGNFTKEIIEEKISDGLRLLMEMYSNEWTTECKDCEGSGETECTICEGSGENEDEGECNNCEGNCVEICRLCDGEGELLLYKAMEKRGINKFKQGWELITLNNRWDSKQYNLINEEDGNNLDSYYDIIDA